MEKLLIQRMDPTAKLPIKQHLTDSGHDLFAHTFHKIFVHQGANGERMYGDGKTDSKLKYCPSIVLGRDEVPTSVALNYLERILIGTGIKATVGSGYEIQIRPRSGLAINNGLTVLNTPGTVDEQYRGEISVIIVNLSRETKTINIGDRIAQLVVSPVTLVEVQEVIELPPSDRGESGFGSSGVR